MLFADALDRSSVIGATAAHLVLGAAAALCACAGQVPPGASCDLSSECQTGLECRFALGSGCGGRGTCSIATPDCSGSGAGLILCGCGGAHVDLSCIPSSATLPQRTTTGAACAIDGGSDSPTTVD